MGKWCNLWKMFQMGWFNHHLGSRIDIPFLSPVASVHPILRTRCMSSSSLDFQCCTRLIFTRMCKEKTNKENLTVQVPPTWTNSEFTPENQWLVQMSTFPFGRPSLFSEGINSRHLTWLDLHSEVGRNCAKKWVYLVTFDIDQWMQNAPAFSSDFLQVLCQILLGI